MRALWRIYDLLSFRVKVAASLGVSWPPRWLPAVTRAPLPPDPPVEADTSHALHYLVLLMTFFVDLRSVEFFFICK